MKSNGSGSRGGGGRTRRCVNFLLLQFFSKREIGDMCYSISWWLGGFVKVCHLTLHALNTVGLLFPESMVRLFVQHCTLKNTIVGDHFSCI